MPGGGGSIGPLIDKTDTNRNSLRHPLVPLLVHDSQVEAGGAVAPGAALLQQGLGLLGWVRWMNGGEMNRGEGEACMQALKNHLTSSTRTYIHPRTAYTYTHVLTHLNRVPLVLFVPGGGPEEVAGQRVAAVGDPLVAGLAQNAVRGLDVLCNNVCCSGVWRVWGARGRRVYASLYIFVSFIHIHVMIYTCAHACTCATS